MAPQPARVEPQSAGTGSLADKRLQLDGHTTITLSLALAMIAGVYQYGRQSQQVDDMTHKIEALTDKVGALTVSVAQLVERIDVQRQANLAAQRLQQSGRR